MGDEQSAECAPAHSECARTHETVTERFPYDYLAPPGPDDHWLVGYVPWGGIGTFAPFQDRAEAQAFAARNGGTVLVAGLTRWQAAL